MANYNKTPLGADDAAHSYYAAPKIDKAAVRANKTINAASASSSVTRQQMAYTPKHMLHSNASASASASPPPPSTKPQTYAPAMMPGNYYQTGPDGKRTTVIRSGGGKKWEDPTLLEWDPSHFRLFVGNLGGEVSDETLHKAFSKYPSLSRSRVIRDKQQELKSKGYGFVAFRDPEDYFRAFKDMNGKYIGSHPVLLRKAQTEIKAKSVKGTKPYERATSSVLKASTLGQKIKKHK
ncbi:hypothetical protein V1512DRAFT_261472 [Lipomyces arxii]|uniref:uncharacterized protein n=1 Tax=Lipomyces arxii TaxID=56418 RepID=UPI0034CFA1C6